MIGRPGPGVAERIMNAGDPAVERDALFHLAVRHGLAGRPMNGRRDDANTVLGDLLRNNPGFLSATSPALNRIPYPALAVPIAAVGLPVIRLLDKPALVGMIEQIALRIHFGKMENGSAAIHIDAELNDPVVDIGPVHALLGPRSDMRNGLDRNGIRAPAVGIHGGHGKSVFGSVGQSVDDQIVEPDVHRPLPSARIPADIVLQQTVAYGFRPAQSDLSVPLLSSQVFGSGRRKRLASPGPILGTTNERQAGRQQAENT